METQEIRKEKLVMACDNKLNDRKLEKLQKKYVVLKKNYKRLLGVTLILTDAIEHLIKGEMKTKINDILLSCSSVYPDLFETPPLTNLQIHSEKLTNDLYPQTIQIIDENGKVFDNATESEKEYFEGFLARPRIPRTPLI